MGPDTGSRQVTILLGLYNGASVLAPQLNSFLSQSHRDWRLIVSDDGSSDNGPDRITRFAAAAGREVELLRGPCQGFGRNYLGLLRRAGADTPYVALSDQDDVWLPGKLERALAHLDRVPAGVPALYGARTWVCDENLRGLRPSPLFRHPPGFRNALVQSIAGGNTMMLNRAALDIVQGAAAEADEIVAHDWWLYQIVSGAGGTVIYDPEPSVLYRQHGGNQIGANDTLAASLHRMTMLAKGRFREWNAINLSALEASSHRFTAENRALLATFAELRDAWAGARVAGLARLGLYRQTGRGQAALWLAAASGLM